MSTYAGVVDQPRGVRWALAAAVGAITLILGVLPAVMAQAGATDAVPPVPVPSVSAPSLCLRRP